MKLDTFHGFIRSINVQQTALAPLLLLKHAG